MPKAHIIALLLWLAAAALAVALVAAGILFPDAPRLAIWAMFIGGIALAIALLIAAMVVAARDAERATNERRRSILPLSGMAVLGAALIVGLAWVFWPSDPLDKSRPGFAAYGVLRLFDTPELRRRYIFELKSAEGGKAAFYLSASGRFTFSVTDTNGETYPIEAKAGRGGIPIDSVIVLLCEAGIVDRSTVLRVVVNNRIRSEEHTSE